MNKKNEFYVLDSEGPKRHMMHNDKLGNANGGIKTKFFRSRPMPFLRWNVKAQKIFDKIKGKNKKINDARFWKRCTVG